MTSIRIGNGYDIHRLIDGDGLVLGGQHIPFHKKFEAHSDGDCLIHAIIDAIFGAIGDGDIGSHFPDNDIQYKGADSAKLLARTVGIMHAAGYHIGNVDATIICQQPKLRELIDAMRRNLAQLLGCDMQNVSVKAKTKEHCDAVGQGEAVEVYAVALLYYL